MKTNRCDGIGALHIYAQAQSVSERAEILVAGEKKRKIEKKKKKKKKISKMRPRCK